MNRTAGESAPRKTPLFRALLSAVASAGGLALVLVVSTWISVDRSYAERAATDLVMPLGAFWLLLMAAATFSWKRRHRATAVVLVMAWLLVGVMFNGRVGGTWLRSLETPPASDAEMNKRFDVIVLLGGYAGLNRLGEPQIGRDGQRLVQTAQLWHSGATKSIICTGTGPPGWGEPSATGRALLVSLGTPDDVIFEVGGPNTQGEMRELSKFFDQPPDDFTELVDTDEPRVGLVTSAYHMPRAMRLAAVADLEFVALPCNFAGAPPGSFTPRELIPTVDGGRSFAVAMKECLAKLVGR